MKFLNSFFALCALLSCSFSVSAGTQTGYVSNIYVRASDGLIYVFLDGPASGRPACAKMGYFMIKNENSLAGKQQFAQLLAAKTSGQQITIYGTNTCTRWPDGEDIENVVS